MINNIIDLLVAPVRLFWRHALILYQTSLVEIRGLYAGSQLGLFWLLLGPALLLSLYAFIYAVVFNVRPSDMTQVEYIIYIFCGLIPFLGFSAALVSGVTSLSANKSILSNTVFPAELIAFRAVIVSAVTMCMGLLLVCMADVLRGEATMTLLLLPVVIVLQTMFLVGLVWILSLLNLVFRDVQQFVNYITIMLLIASPIAYTPSMIPETMKLVIYLNPLSYYVVAFQDLILLNTLPPINIMVIGAVLAITSFSLGFWVFQKAKQGLFDYV